MKVKLHRLLLLKVTLLALSELRDEHLSQQQFNSGNSRSPALAGRSFINFPPGMAVSKYSS